MDSIAHNSITVLPYSSHPIYFMTKKNIQLNHFFHRPTDYYITDTAHTVLYQHILYFLYTCTFIIVLWKHILYSLKRHIPYTVLSTHISYCFYALLYRHIPYYFIQTYSLLYTATCHTISWCFIQWYSVRYTPPDWVCRVSSCLAWSNICKLYDS